MSQIIKEFYQNKSIPDMLIQHKLNKFSKYPDIQTEFEYWIQNKRYSENYPVEVEGYTAKYIASLSKYMDGEGSFMQLMELRENPKSAIQQIKDGFKMK